MEILLGVYFVGVYFIMPRGLLRLGSALLEVHFVTGLLHCFIRSLLLMGFLRSGSASLGVCFRRDLRWGSACFGACCIEG